MKKELLVPVGSMSHLPYAIFNGCDAVYLGGKRFGARAFAQNFTLEELKEAIAICHLYGVKIYVTVNTMIYEREFNETLNYVEFLYKNHVDAVIVSDLGLITVIHKKYPNLEIHLSTQAHTKSASEIFFYKALGIKRVVLDRELSLEEIALLPPVMDYEVFIHGALCVSYSGECLMSALNEGRSGNRGTCAQYCRMKYKIIKDKEYLKTDGDYLLSTKELNTTKQISKLRTSNIKSFKIEGRMKSKEYVGFITNLYRKLIDAKEPNVTQKDQKDLESLFTRSFTEGYLNSCQDIMNYQTPNHIGILLGHVLKISAKKIKIKLKEDLHQGDGIKFLPEDIGMIANFIYDEKNRLIHEGKKGSIIYLDNKISLKTSKEIRKTLDKNLMDSLARLKEKKIAITMSIIAAKETFTLTITDGQNKIFVTEKICEEAQKIQTTKEEIIKQMNKLGNTPYEIKNISVQLEDSLFIPIVKMNALRRKSIDLLSKKRMGIDEN